MIKDNPTTNLYYKLTQDIYLNDVSDISAWDDDPMTVPAGINAWTPIGLQSANTNDATTRDFQGHFDGAGFTVYGLYVSQEYYYGGLFGKIVGYTPVPEGTPEGTVIEQLDTYEEYATATVEDVPAGVSNLTIAYSVVNGYYYVGAVSGYGTRAYFDNCVVDDTVTTIIVGRQTNKGGVAGIVGRMQGLIEDCTSSATVLAHLQPVEKDPENGDTTLVYPYPQFTGGVTAVMVGIMNRCANFGDVSTYVIGGLLCAYIGGDSIGSCAYDCLVEGTLSDGWVGKYDPDIAERRVIARCGILVCRTAHTDAPVDYNVQRCVSAGRYAEDFDTAAVTAIGRVAGQNQGWVGTKDILYVNTGFPEEMAITGDWDAKACFLWTNIYEITPEEYAEYRAQYAQ